MSGQGLFSGAAGMENAQIELDVIANNLANSGTVGFKKSDANFADLVYQDVKAVGADSGDGTPAPNGIQIGSGSRLAGTSIDFSQGGSRMTKKDLDIMISGDGFLEVQKPDGTTAYTRAGNLKVNSNSEVTDSTGNKILSNFQAIPTGSKVVVSDNGQVSVQDPSGSNSTFRINLVRFPNPSGLKSIGNNLYEESASSGAPESGNPGENGFGSTVQGYLEMSNVDTVLSMVGMIKAQRLFELNSKSIRTGDEMRAEANRVKQ